MKKKNKIILTALMIILLSILGVLSAKTYIESNLEKLSDLIISEVALTKLQDGIYTGSYKAFPVEAEVKVTIDKNKIKEIELVKHLNGQGAAAEILPQKVVEAQSLKVDIVSGATYSSKVILKAIENALAKGKE